MGTKIIWLEPLDRVRLWLRRYRSSAEHKCAKTGSYCNAMFLLGDFDAGYSEGRYLAGWEDQAPPASDSRWPLECEACGTPFSSEEPHQLFQLQLYARLDTGAFFTLEEAPPGAVWDAWWISERRSPEQRGCGWMTGPDGRSLMVRMPDGSDWSIDSRASNCTLKNDNAHYCWVRHGRPEDGTLHVDKNGLTCSAGAGSIDTGTWHGVLHHGELNP